MIGGYPRQASHCLSAAKVHRECWRMSPLSEHGKSIFLQTLDLVSAEERQQFLAAACGDDSCLRQQIEELLAHHSQASGYLESPPTEVVEAARHDTDREDDASPVLD